MGSSPTLNSFNLPANVTSVLKKKILGQDAFSGCFIMGCWVGDVWLRESVHMVFLFVFYLGE